MTQQRRTEPSEDALARARAVAEAFEAGAQYGWREAIASGRVRRLRRVARPLRPARNRTVPVQLETPRGRQDKSMWHRIAP